MDAQEVEDQAHVRRVEEEGGRGDRSTRVQMMKEMTIGLTRYYEDYRLDASCLLARGGNF